MYLVIQYINEKNKKEYNKGLQSKKTLPIISQLKTSLFRQ